jgi:subtilisin family serine protease
MSSPHVAGVAALLLQEDPTVTPAQLTARMLNDSTKGLVTDEGSGSPNRMLYTGAINERALATSDPTSMMVFQTPSLLG